MRSAGGRPEDRGPTGHRHFPSHVPVPGRGQGDGSQGQPSCHDHQGESPCPAGQPDVPVLRRSRGQQVRRAGGSCRPQLVDEQEESNQSRRQHKQQRRPVLQSAQHQPHGVLLLSGVTASRLIPFLEERAKCLPIYSVRNSLNPESTLSRMPEYSSRLCRHTLMVTAYPFGLAGK